MWYLASKLPKEKHLAAMKRKFDSPFLIFDERLTGIVIGPFFAVAHYQAWEWNRRITIECNRAWGYVKDGDGELEIRFLRGKGLLAPISFLVVTVFCRLIFWFAELNTQESLGWVLWGAAALCALIACGVTAIQDCLTEAGQTGAKEINKFLTDPENYYC